MKNNETIYNGIRFIKHTKEHYLAAWVKIEGKKKKMKLHQYVWYCHNGLIPKGYEIHHIDFDKDNNDISNLQLLTPKEHKRVHWDILTEEEKQAVLLQKNKALDDNRHKAAEWHGSEDGIEWHRDHARKSILNEVPEKRTCIECKAVYETKMKAATKFCTARCKNRYNARRYRADGRYKKS